MKGKPMKAYELNEAQINGHSELYDLAVRAGHASLKSMLNDSGRWGDEVENIADDLKKDISEAKAEGGKK